MVSGVQRERYVPARLVRVAGRTGLWREVERWGYETITGAWVWVSRVRRVGERRTMAVPSESLTLHTLDGLEPGRRVVLRRVRGDAGTGVVLSCGQSVDVDGGWVRRGAEWLRVRDQDGRTRRLALRSVAPSTSW